METDARYQSPLVHPSRGIRSLDSSPCSSCFERRQVETAATPTMASNGIHKEDVVGFIGLGKCLPLWLGLPGSGTEAPEPQGSAWLHGLSVIQAPFMMVTPRSSCASHIVVCDLSRLHLQWQNMALGLGLVRA